MNRRKVLYACAYLYLQSAMEVVAGERESLHLMAKWATIIAEASQRFGIPEAWIEAVMLAESAGQTHLNGELIRSKVGAMGLMQVMPGTWAEMRQRHRLGADPDDPRDNILAGTAYLRAMYDRFGYPGLFAAYNAGPARYEASLTGRPLPAETQTYLARITQSLRLRRFDTPVREGPEPVEPSPLVTSDRGLFAIKRDAKPAEKPVHPGFFRP